MFKGFNFFGGEKKEIPKNSDDNLNLGNKFEDEEKKDILEGLSLEEKIKVLEEKKNEISQLEEERLEYYYKAKDFEDRMISVGLNEEQRKKIKEQISKEGGEISQKIIDIRKEFGIEPTPVEILSNRMIMMMAEKDRLSKNLQTEKKDKLKFVNSTIAKLKERDIFPNDIISNFLTSIEHRKNSEDLDKNKDLFELFDQISAIMKEKSGYSDLIMVSLNHFSGKLKENIEKNSLYKTPLEEKNGLQRYNKVLEIIDNIHSELKRARQGEGHYAKK
jgi:hypothetical protein